MKTTLYKTADITKTTWQPKSFFQPELTINQPNDIYEKEADAVADKVMKMPVQNNEQPFFQSKPIITPVQRKCAHCEKEEKVQMKETPGAVGGMTAPSTVNDVINSPGQSLDKGTRNFMESRFGYDFGNVRIHNDSIAHQSSKEINALAYTHGSHVVFGAGQYQPGTNSGKQLLAHELVHVIQQNKSYPGRSIQRWDVPMPPPEIGSQTNTKRYEVDIIKDKARQVRTTGSVPVHAQLSYSEASENFTVTFPLAWAFVRAWPDSKRKDFVNDFEKSVLRVWQDRFLLKETIGQRRSAHVYINFDEKIVAQQKDDFTEGSELSRIIQSSPTPWLMDVRDLGVRANVSGYTVHLGEKANEPNSATGKEIRKETEFSERSDGDDKKIFTQTVSPHEFGHMIGLGDEYLNDSGTAPKAARRRINNRIMNVGEVVTPDVYMPFADWLSGLTKSKWTVGKKVK